MNYIFNTKRELLQYEQDLNRRDIKSNIKVSKDKDGLIVISGINLMRFRTRITDVYGIGKEKRIYSLFIPVFNEHDLADFNDRRISMLQIRITEIKIVPFFACEVIKMFDELATRFKDSVYREIYYRLKEITWVNKSESNSNFVLDLKPLENLNYTLKDYQLEFIKNYYNIKNKNGLEGYILAFDQGLGKTLTSISLAECLKKNSVYIVCPNSLKENWANEIRQYYKRYIDEELWREEVCIIGNNDFQVTEKTRFFIVNLESIDKVFKYTKNNNNMIIVDESHNFRNIDSKRTKNLIKLKELLNCKDVLMMSGTPIKGSPSEIAPSLKMIDPLFTDEASRIYNISFNCGTSLCKSVLRSRLDTIIYRRTKLEALPDLPKKEEKILTLNVNDPSKYYLSNIRKEIGKLFREYYFRNIKNEDEYFEELVGFINRYSSATNEKNEDFKKLVYDKETVSVNYYRDISLWVHDKDVELIRTFIRKYLLPNVNNKDDYDRIIFLQKKFINLRNSCMGKALGRIIPKMRSEMFIDLYRTNRDLIVEKIQKRTKKTIIFTSSLEFANYVYEDINKNTILRAVKVTGDTKDRFNVIEKFKNSDSIDVLVATTQTISTGFTITEASQIIFFGTPWRSADYEQACDRIHRIKQTDDVIIWRVFLNSPEETINDGYEKSLNWSKNMFSEYIEYKNKK